LVGHVARRRRWRNMKQRRPTSNARKSSRRRRRRRRSRRRRRRSSGCGGSGSGGGGGGGSIVVGSSSSGSIKINTPLTWIAASAFVGTGEVWDTATSRSTPSAIQPHHIILNPIVLSAARTLYTRLYPFTRSQHTRTRVYTLCTVFPSSTSLAFTFARFTPSVSITAICSFCWYNKIIISVIYISCV